MDLGYLYSLGYFFAFYFCNILIYNKKYVFDLCLHFWHRTSKNSVISHEDSKKGFLPHVNEVALGPHRGMGAGWRWGQAVIRVVDLSAPAARPLGREDSWTWSSMANSQ